MMKTAGLQGQWSNDLMWALPGKQPGKTAPEEKVLDFFTVPNYTIQMNCRLTISTCNNHGKQKDDTLRRNSA